jgi:two-component system LytT family sensor kinase
MLSSVKQAEEIEKTIPALSPLEQGKAYIALAAAQISFDNEKSYESAAKALQLAKDLKNDELHIDALIRLGSTFFALRDITQSGVYFQLAEDMARSIGYTKGELHAMQNKALYYVHSKRLNEAYNILQHTIPAIKTLGQMDWYFDGLSYLYMYYSEVDIAKGMELAQNAIEEAREQKLAEPEAIFLHCLGDSADKAKLWDDAIKYFGESVPILEQMGQDIPLIGALQRLGSLHNKSGHLNEAALYYNRAIKLAEKIGDNSLLAYTLSTCSEIIALQGDMAKAMEYAERGVELTTLTGADREIGHAYFYLGRVYLTCNRPLDAIDAIQKSYELRKNSLKPNGLLTTYSTLHKAYNKAGLYKEAYETLTKYMDLRMQMLSEERAKLTNELHAKYETERKEAELKELKIKQQQSELEKTESELKAIKAQMNPHFIFNALNSIQEMFFIGDKRLANEHLGQFSQLTRQILKASGKQYVSLTEEVDMLDKYLSLEGLRFETGFSYNIHCNIDEADDLLIPPMLLQPYIENAIRHGLLHKKGNKNIDVLFQFKPIEKQLVCVITDNGVGRKASAEINKNRSSLHQSFSTSANSKRLELLNQNLDKQIGVVYNDLENENFQSIGTQVTITIPVNYD